MQSVNERVKGMKWTATAVGISFVNMLFVLVALGVPWHSLANSSLDATPLFFVSKNSGPLKKAGDPAFALLFIGGIIHIFAVQALYVRWAGRESRIPHTAKACIILFTSAALFMFLSFVVYSGIVHKENLSPPAGSNPNPLVYPGTGHSGPGFALAVFIFCVNAVTAVGLWRSRAEIDEADTKAAQLASPDAGELPGTPGQGAHPFHPTAFVSRWGKTKFHSTAVALAVLNLLFLIMSLGLPWWEVDNGASYGLVQNFQRIPSNLALRKGGDPAFAFTFLAFLAQIHSTFAITLRFLGRDDSFSANIPHSLTACVVSTSISCFCSFLAFVIYAAVTNSKNKLGGVLNGGFALIVLVWLLTGVVLALLIVKKSEVENAPAASLNTPVAFPSGYPAPTGNPMTFSPPVPAYGNQPTWGAPADGGYPQVYPPQPLYTAPTAPVYTEAVGEVPVEVLDEHDKVQSEAGHRARSPF